jgi:hypothetical protein
VARLAAGIFFVSAVVWLAWCGLASLAPAVTIPAGNAKPTPAVAGYTGVGSCASASCHGGAIDSPFAWQRSYSVWSTEDKHSRAYQVLFSDQAKRIVQLLDNLPSPEQAKPFADHRCLGCHTTIDPAAPRGRDMLADGVGCESCHGPAQTWLVDHTRWPSPLAETDGRAKAVAAMRRELFTAHDMKNTKDVFVAAGVCVDCHVGGPQAPGATVSRDMNHDMIAAGHPRLNFEFSAYLARMPRHWHQRTDEAKAWAVGQAVTAQASLRLLTARADAAASELSTGKSTSWPEFSEFDCFRCHHDLRGTNTGQRARLTIPEADRPVPGGYLWGTWHFAMTRALAAGNNEAEYSSKITALSRLMAQPFAEPKSVRDSVAEVTTALDLLVASLQDQHYDLTWIHRTLVEVASPSRVFTWDQAAQAYLACVALNNERLWRSRDVRSPLDPEIERQLLRLRDTLRFGHSGQVQFNSPRDFDPLAIQAELRRLQELFEKLGP